MKLSPPLMATEREPKMPERFRKKQVEVEALRYTGDNADEIARWAGWMTVHVPDDAYRIGDKAIIVRTLNGEVRVFPGEWVIKGAEGEFYPCKPDIFDATYEPVEESDDGD